ncbi:MAG: DUF4349 domain-containing protein [Candidatus Taylorbacteria bacterium]|nr:DUF4349 domain-containing protein [Candidatus Taylorbacteria bacterium]
MHNFIKKLEKRWGGHKVFWGGVVIFLVLLGIMGVSFMNSDVYYREIMLGQMSPMMPSGVSRGMMRDVTFINRDFVDSTTVRNGSLNIITHTADEAIRSIADMAARYGGFVEKSYVYDVAPSVRAATIAIRVPNGYFDASIRDIHNLATKINYESINVQDGISGTGDIDMKLASFKATEKQYKDLLAKTTKVDDILKIRYALNLVQGNIATLQNESINLSHEGALARISVSLTSEKVLTTSLEWKPWLLIKNAFSNLCSDLLQFSQFLILFLLALPVFIFKLSIFALILIGIWKIILWVEKELKTNGHKR